MLRKKHLPPELSEQYSHWYGEYMRQTDKKRITLFVIWLVVLLCIGVVNFAVMPDSMPVSIVFFLWSLLGLTVTLIDYNKRMAYIEEHVYADKMDEAKKANGEK